MAVVFGVGSTLGAVFLLFIWVLLYSLHVLVSNAVAAICAGAWIIFTLRLWVALVIIGKTERAARTSDLDLRAMSLLFFVVVCFNALFHPSAKTEWHTIGMVFEWIVIALHVIYFLLALCVWVRVPHAIWLRFAVGLLLVLWQTWTGHGV